MSRSLPFWVAVALFGAAFALELGARAFVGAEAGAARDGAVVAQPLGEDDQAGLAIPAIALIDASLLVGLGLMALGQRSPAKTTRTGGVVVAGAGLLVVVLGVATLVAAFSKLMVMLGLLMTPLFGQALYLALFGDFPRTAASVTLGLLMALRIGGGVALVLWSGAVLRAKGLVLLVLSSLGAGVVISFLLGAVPLVLASVTDAVAAIVVCVVAIVWGLVQLVSGVSSIAKVVAPSSA